MLAELEQSRTSGPKPSGLSMSSVTIGTTSDPKTISKGCSYLPNRSELSSSTKLPSSITSVTGYSSALGATSTSGVVSMSSLTNPTSSPYSATSALTNGAAGTALSSTIGPSGTCFPIASAFTSTSLLEKSILEKTLYNASNPGMHIPPMQQSSFQHTIKNMPALSQVRHFFSSLF